MIPPGRSLDLNYAKAGKRQLEVLIIEDNPDERYLIQTGLREAVPEFSLNLRIAEDGEQALAILLADRYRPDMILLDLSLPRIDGKTVLQRVRAHGVDLASTPIVVFSSHEHGIQEILDAGANAYIVKPMSLMAYLKAIERFAVLFLKSRATAAA